MDSITHIALGACIGEAFFKKGFGKKAMLWGALAQSIPDIDFMASFWLDTSDNLLAHRGFTHSILFALIIIPLLALIADKIHRPHNNTFRKWLMFFGTEVFAHLILDGYNNYGVGWFEPFIHNRYSLNTVYVADAFFSIWPVIAAIVLLILNSHSPKRKFWWRFGVVLPLLYLGYCTFNKIVINKKVKEILVKQHIPHDRYFTTPAPLQNWLWFVVSGNDSGYYTGYRSVFDSKDKIDFQYFPRNDSLLNQMKDDKTVEDLRRFAQDFYTVEKWTDTLVFNDLRFGQIIGWKDPREKFVFHYFLGHPRSNDLVVQRGRFAKWDKDVIRELWKRIKGN